MNQVEFLWLAHAFATDVTEQRSNHFVASLLKKGTDARMEMNNFSVVRKVLRNITDLAISLVITCFG